MWQRQAKPARLVSVPAHFDRWHPERLFEYRSPHSRENLPLRFFQSEELFGFPAILPTHFVRPAHFAGAEFLFESFPHRSPIDSLADLRLQSLALRGAGACPASCVEQSHALPARNADGIFNKLLVS
jgi:hypothetical protein